MISYETKVSYTLFLFIGKGSTIEPNLCFCVYIFMQLFKGDLSITSCCLPHNPKFEKRYAFLCNVDLIIKSNHLICAAPFDAINNRLQINEQTDLYTIKRIRHQHLADTIDESTIT